MTETWAFAALWLGLALLASLISIWLRIATALSEMVVGAHAHRAALAVRQASARFEGLFERFHLEWQNPSTSLPHCIRR